MNGLRLGATLTPLAPSELAQVSAFSKTIWAQSYVPEVLTPEEAAHFWAAAYSEEAMLQDMQQGGRYFWVVKGGERIGFCSLRLDPSSSTARLGKLYLRAEDQGQGHGQRVIEALKSRCIEASCSYLWLYVFRKNQRAIKAYQRAGFHIIRYETTDAGCGFFYEDAVMALDITSGPAGTS